MENEDTDWENRLLWKMKIRTGRIGYCGKLRYGLGEEITVEAEVKNWENRLVWKMKTANP